mgnify:CR=1 FL=1
MSPPYANLTPEQADKLIATGFLRMGPDGTADGGVHQLFTVVGRSDVGTSNCTNVDLPPIDFDGDKDTDILCTSFEGVNLLTNDGKGNFTLGVKEQIIFPEIEYDKVAKVRGMNITICTSAGNDEGGRALLGLVESAVFVMAFAYLPLADTHALSATSPLMVVARWATFPNSDCMPVANTTARPWPERMVVPAKARLGRSSQWPSSSGSPAATRTRTRPRWTT